jgi:uncharacterized protein YqjF (DUF2071 family)
VKATGIFLTAEWRYVSLLNFEVDASVLSPLLPRGCELDDWGGRHFISLIGFLFLDTHVLGVPAFFHRDFEEVNLRFYVRRDIGGERRRGVVFIRELVPLPLVAGAARLTYNEPYRTVPMQHTLVATESELQSVEFCFGGPHDECRLTFHANSASREMAANSEEEFLSHRLWGYTRQRDGGTVEYRVDHARWNIWSPVDFELDGPLAEFYDEPFASILREAPVSAFIADGSAVAVHLPERIA